MHLKIMRSVALKLYRREDEKNTNFDIVRICTSKETEGLEKGEFEKCCGYVDEIFMIGETEYIRKYKIKEAG